MMKLTILGSFLLLSAVPIKQDKAPEIYAVVVNTKNTCSDAGDAAKATIKQLFLKQMTKWANGTDAKPYGRSAGDAEEIAFVRDVLGMGDAELARHWLKVKNMNGTTPPKAVSSDRMLLKYIEKHEGAFAVVKLSEIKGATGIKILYRF